MTEQQTDADRRFGPRATAVIREWTGAHPAEDREPSVAEAELDYWMARAYEAEGKLWKAEARIRHLEATARVLVKEVLDAENARDESRRGKAEAEARIKAVENLHVYENRPVEKWARGHRYTGEHCAHDGEQWPCRTIRALDGA